MLPVLAIFTGLICVGGFALNLDRYMQFVPLSVLQGFTLGVSISIALNQLDFGLGLPKYKIIFCYPKICSLLK